MNGTSTSLQAGENRAPRLAMYWIVFGCGFHYRCIVLF